MTELEFYFRSGLRRLLLNPGRYEELIKSYQLSKPDIQIRDKLRALVEEGIATAQHTGVYLSEIQRPEISETIALQSVKLEGLIAFVFLGQKTVIPDLLSQLRKDRSKNIKRQIVAGMALRYLTGQEIGTTSFFEDEWDLWEEWWEQNKSI